MSDLDASIPLSVGSPSRISALEENDNPGMKSVVVVQDVELLIHIVSHSDILLQLRSASGTHFIAKPDTQQVEEISQKVYERLAATVEKDGVNCQVIRNGSKPQRKSGLYLGDNEFQEWPWNSFQMRGDDELSEAELAELPVVTGVFMPKLAVLIPKWISVLKSNTPNTRKVVYLIAAINAAEETVTATVGVSRLCGLFLDYGFQADLIEVQYSNSGIDSDILKYDDNVEFVARNLLPEFEEIRSRLAEYTWSQGLRNSEWLKKMHVVLSLTDGVPARVAAITAAMRQFRPDTLHLFNLTSGHGMERNELRRKDVQYHPFDKMAMYPATSVYNLESQYVKLVSKMIDYRKRFNDSIAGTNDFEDFWLRKSKRPVLSVLLVTIPGFGDKFYHGMNMEVSMPTGSLCAERNAISTALAENPSLMRRHLKAIAVLQVSLSVSGVGTNPMQPCGACSEWLKKIARVNPDFKVITFTSEDCEEAYIKSVFGLMED